MKTISLSGFLLAATTLAAQAPAPINIQEIPAALRTNAHAVVRSYEKTLIVSSPAVLQEQTRRVVTILDHQGLKHARIKLEYNTSNTLRDLSVVVFDEAGNELKTYRKRDFQDLSMLDDMTMAEDERYLWLDLDQYSPPFTVALQYTYQTSGILSFPDFKPQFSYHLSVEKARCELRIPDGQTLHHKSIGGPGPAVLQAGNTTVYTWNFQELPAVPDEPFNLPLDQLTPLVKLSPGQFSMEGFAGSFDSWDAFARWNQQLQQSLPLLNQDVVREIRQKTQYLPELERIRAVYHLVQKSTRYVSIQLGIGGWRPFDPNLVHVKKYGDCKALSWYTRALLQAAGIPAYYTLVNAGDYPNEPDPDFPDNVFNHVILAVPTSAGDTVWLECTSQTNPFGYLGLFTGNRKALLLDEGKSCLVSLPALSTEQNLHIDSVQIHLETDAKSVQVQWWAGYAGLTLETSGFLGVIHDDPQEQRTWVEQQFALKGGQMESFNLQMDTISGRVPCGQVSVQASSGQLFQVSMRRLFFQPNFFQPWKTFLLPDNARVSPVMLRFGNSYVADMTVDIPAGWTPESLPADLEETTLFGNYRRTVTFVDGQMHYRRTITLSEGTFPPERFNDLVVFYKKMKKWDGETAVFVRP